MKKYGRWSKPPLCTRHGNSHKRHSMAHLFKQDGQGEKRFVGWRCPDCGREFDENLIPMHPPPSRKDWEKWFELKHGWSAERQRAHDSLIDSACWYLENR